jgi:hypothetical protein
MANVTLDEMFRRAVDLNLRYYGAVGKLAADYMRDLVNVMSDLQLVPGTAGRSAAATAPTARPGAAQMVLEAAAGETALGVFLVENSLPQEVKAAVVASAFTDASGRQLKPKIAFDPPTVSLRPGEQLLVRVQGAITADMEPDVRYYGEFLIPALQGTRIPVVFRRRPAA